MEKVPGLLKFCARSASVDGLSYLVENFSENLPLGIIVESFRYMNKDSFTNSSMKVP